jgi:hypothetical protein
LLTVFPSSSSITLITPSRVLLHSTYSILDLLVLSSSIISKPDRPNTRTRTQALTAFLNTRSLLQDQVDSIPRTFHTIIQANITQQARREHIRLQVRKFFK